MLNKSRKSVDPHPLTRRVRKYSRPNVFDTWIQSFPHPLTNGSQYGSASRQARLSLSLSDHNWERVLDTLALVSRPLASGSTRYIAPGCSTLGWSFFHAHLYMGATRICPLCTRGVASNPLVSGRDNYFHPGVLNTLRVNVSVLDRGWAQLDGELCVPQWFEGVLPSGRASGTSS